MKIKSLEIALQPSYCTDNAGKYIATVHYEDRSGAVKLVLEPGISESLLSFVGPVLAKYAQQAAGEIAQNIIASVEEAKRLPEITL